MWLSGWKHGLVHDGSNCKPPAKPIAITYICIHSASPARWEAEACRSASLKNSVQWQESERPFWHKVEGENQLLKLVFSPPHTCHGIHTHVIQTHKNTSNTCISAPHTSYTLICILYSLHMNIRSTHIYHTHTYNHTHIYMTHIAQTYIHTSLCTERGGSIFKDNTFKLKTYFASLTSSGRT